MPGETAALLKTKSVYDQPDDSDGVRVLVTRYWPRGVKKEKAAYWLKDLGPTPALIKDWKAGKISWGDFKERYEAEWREGDKDRLLEELEGIVKKAGKNNVTLLCTCREEAECHRGILREKLTGC